MLAFQLIVHYLNRDWTLDAEQQGRCSVAEFFYLEYV